MQSLHYQLIRLQGVHLVFLHNGFGNTFFDYSARHNRIRSDIAQDSCNKLQIAVLQIVIGGFSQFHTRIARIIIILIDQGVVSIAPLQADEIQFLHHRQAFTDQLVDSVDRGIFGAKHVL